MADKIGSPRVRKKTRQETQKLLMGAYYQPIKTSMFKTVVLETIEKVEAEKGEALPVSIERSERVIDTPTCFYINSPPGLERFRVYVKSIMIWLGLYHKSCSQVRDILRCFRGSDMADEENQFRQGLTFSVANYRANKMSKLSQDSLQYLRSNPKYRNQEEIRLVKDKDKHDTEITTGLMGYSSIADMSKTAIDLIAKKGWYQEFDSYSVIVREGNWPLYYYMILSGAVLVSVVDKEKMKAEVVCTLSRGEAFGELSLIYQTRRASTVVTKEKTGLLILSDDDYIDVFMNGGVKLAMDPFLTTVPCFHEFPMDCLKDNFEKVKYSYFKPGQIMVEDSKLSSWIFILKSGRARVVMPVRKAALIHAKEVAKMDDLTVERKEEEEARQALLRQTKMDHEAVLSRLTRQHLKGLLEKKHLLAGEPISIKVFRMNPDEELRDLSKENSKVTFKLPPIRGAHFRQVQDKGRSRTGAKISIKEKPSDITYSGSNDTVVGVRTLATDLNAEFFHEQQLRMRLQRKEEEKVMIPVQRLESPSYFGLTEYLFDSQPSLKLISEGCECFVIHKDLYMENFSESLIYKVNHKLRPFPQEEDVVAKNVHQLKWREIRNEVLGNTVLYKQLRYFDVHDSLTRFPPMPSF